MNSKERVLCTVNLETPDSIPMEFDVPTDNVKAMYDSGYEYGTYKK